MSAVMITFQRASITAFVYIDTSYICQEVKKRLVTGNYKVSVTVPYSGIILLLQNKQKKTRFMKYKTV